MSTREAGGLSKGAGFSLLEVLLASLVLCFGLAGFAALLLASMAGATESHQRSAAVLAATTLAEQLRMHPAALGRYLDPPENMDRVCNSFDDCTPDQQADYDFRLWQHELADRIHGAKGLVCQDGTPQDGGEGDALCDGAGPLVIKIFWPDKRATTADESRHHRYVLETS